VPSREDVRAVRARAGLFALCLVILSILLVFVSLAASVYLLTRWGIWASPLPILVGMLIESTVTRWHEDSELPEPEGRPRHASILTRLWRWMLADGLWHGHRGTALWVTVCRGTWFIVLMMLVPCLAHHAACDVRDAWMERIATWMGRTAEWIGRIAG
jgi:hypothetical protein